jgi:tetratricopeptide (TPR) repeat protein
MLNLSEGQAALREAEKRLGTCGDLILKFFIRLNSAVWFLENGELAKAVKAFDTVETVIQGTKATKPLVMLNINLGELHFDAHDVDQAKERYSMAESYLSRSSPPYYRTIIHAGFGLCALQEGSLQEARLRESSLDSDPDFWTFDPTLVTIFRARMMIRRGNGEGAIRHLSQTREAIKGRFLSAWIRLLLEEGRIRKRFKNRQIMEDADEAIEVCTRLGLRRRQEDLHKLFSNSAE